LQENSKTLVIILNLQPLTSDKIGVRSTHSNCEYDSWGPHGVAFCANGSNWY